MRSEVLMSEGSVLAQNLTSRAKQQGGFFLWLKKVDRILENSLITDGLQGSVACQEGLFCTQIAINCCCSFLPGGGGFIDDSSHTCCGRRNFDADKPARLLYMILRRPYQCTCDCCQNGRKWTREDFSVPVVQQFFCPYSSRRYIGLLISKITCPTPAKL